MSSNRVAGRSATTSAKVADLEMARINALLDRLDPKIGEPGGIPGEIILSPGRTSNELVAAQLSFEARRRRAAGRWRATGHAQRTSVRYASARGTRRCPQCAQQP